MPHMVRMKVKEFELKIMIHMYKEKDKFMITEFQIDKSEDKNRNKGKVLRGPVKVP